MIRGEELPDGVGGVERRRRCRDVADPLPERARLTAGPLMAHHPALISTTAAIENLDVVGLLNERHESAGLSRLKAL